MSPARLELPGAAPFDASALERLANEFFRGGGAFAGVDPSALTSGVPGSPERAFGVAPPPVSATQWSSNDWPVDEAALRPAATSSLAQATTLGTSAPGRLGGAPELRPRATSRYWRATPVRPGCLAGSWRAASRPTPPSASCSTPAPCSMMRRLDRRERASERSGDEPWRGAVNASDRGRDRARRRGAEPPRRRVDSRAALRHRSRRTAPRGGLVPRNAGRGDAGRLRPRSGAARLPDPG